MKFELDSLLSLKRGISTLSSTLETAYGPRGRFVISMESQVTSLARSGHQISISVDAADLYEKIGIHLFQRLALDMFEKVGDGSKTAVFFAEALLVEGIRLVANGTDPRELNAGLEHALKVSLNYLTRLATPLNTCKELRGLIKTNTFEDNELTDLLYLAYLHRSGPRQVEVWEQPVNNSGLNFLSRIDIFKDNFIRLHTNDFPAQNLLTDVKVFLSTDIVTLDQIKSLIGHLRGKGHSLVMIAPEISQDLKNHLESSQNAIAPYLMAIALSQTTDGFSDQLLDISLASSTPILSESYTEITEEMLGEFRYVKVNENSLGCYGNIIESFDIKAADPQKQCRNSIHDLSMSGKMKERLGFSALISVNAMSQKAKEEKIRMLKGAIKSVEAALEFGFVFGGGKTMLLINKHLDHHHLLNLDQNKGIKVFQNALLSPFIHLANNSGMEGLGLLEKIEMNRLESGFNFANQQQVDLYEDGIIVPARVVSEALKQSVTIVSKILESSCLIPLSGSEEE